MARYLVNKTIPSLFNGNIPDIEDGDLKTITKSVDTAAGAIPLKVALQMIAGFQEEPKSYDVSRALLKEFLDKVSTLKLHVPNGHELGFRFYLGRKTGMNTNYNCVIVPMHGPIPEPGEPRKREEELEKSFFRNAEIDFFALVPSLSAILDDIEDCAELIEEKDPSGVALVYFSEEEFMSFFTELEDPAFKDMTIFFARTPDQNRKLTTVIMFFDVNSDVVGATIGSNKEVKGVSFDQGDLIPPPSDVPDSSFEP